MTDREQPRTVIVGGGFAGLEAARRLARKGARVTLIDRRNHHLFQPLLYQVATAGLSANEIAYPIRAIFSGSEDAEVILGEVVGIDLDAREVELAAETERVAYDQLVVAAGAADDYFGNEGWRRVAPPLKTLEDALDIRRRILMAFEHAEREHDPARRAALLTFVVVGGGPTGVEIAGAISEIARRVLIDDFRRIDPADARVILVEALPRVLTAYSEKLSAKAAEALAQIGVEVRTSTRVVDIDAGGVELEGERIDADNVLWAAGVRASSLGATLGVPLDRKGRVLVEPDLSIPGHPEAFVVGDLAHLVGADGEPLPGIAPVAIQQGAHVAEQLLRRQRGEATEPFAYWDKGSLATIGRARAVGAVGGFEIWGFPAWIAWMAVHVFFLIGFRNRLTVMVDWAVAYFSFNRTARLITNLVPAENPLRKRDAA